MNICVIGAGYVGLVVASCLSEDNNVICVDKNIEKIEIKIAKIRELYRFFNLYREKMELGGYIDYDDIEFMNLFFEN